MPASDYESRIEWLEKVAREQDRRIESLKLQVAQLEQQVMALRQAPNA